MISRPSCFAAAGLRLRLGRAFIYNDDRLLLIDQDVQRVAARKGQDAGFDGSNGGAPTQSDVTDLRNQRDEGGARAIEALDWPTCSHR